MVQSFTYINVWQLFTAVHVLAICWPLYWFLSDTSIHEGIDGVSDLLIGKKCDFVALIRETGQSKYLHRISWRTTASIVSWYWWLSWFNIWEKNVPGLSRSEKSIHEPIGIWFWARMIATAGNKQRASWIRFPLLTDIVSSLLSVCHR